MCIIILVVIGVRLSERQSQVSQKSVATEQISVVTSFYPLFFFAKEIAQEMALVYNITPSGSEPHEYEPTPQDRASIEKSDLLILMVTDWKPGETASQEISTRTVRVSSLQERVWRQELS